MVAIIIVSHSRKLAEGLKEVLDQISKGKVKVVAVGGAKDGGLGSNAIEIREKILSLSGEDALLVFFDLGSTIISTKAALSGIPKEIAKKTHLIDAPLVEGAFVATVEASAGSPVNDIIKAAEEARNARKFY
jgi:dihydroxyacetone kinase phosphotransfer subunit